MSSKRKGILRSLFTPKVGCGCSDPKLADIINPRPKPRPKASDHHNQMMLLNPLSSSSGSWDRNGSTSRDQNDGAEEDYTSTSFSLTSVATSSEELGSHIPNTPCRASVASQAVLGDNIAMEKYSVNPYNDFQQSILQMIVQRKLCSKIDLQELLNCFLQLNSPLHHHTIIKAFTDLLNNFTSNINGQPHRSKPNPDPHISTEQHKGSSS